MDSDESFCHGFFGVISDFSNRESVFFKFYLFCIVFCAWNEACAQIKCNVNCEYVVGWDFDYINNGQQWSETNGVHYVDRLVEVGFPSSVVQDLLTFPGRAVSNLDFSDIRLMSGRVKHFGMHIYAYDASEEQLKRAARNIKAEIFRGVPQASMTQRFSGGVANFSVQVEVSVRQFSRDGLDIAVKNLEKVLRIFTDEGFAVHVLLSAHDLPIDGWLGVSWSARRWQEAEWNMPYQPCEYREYKSNVCTYDIVFEQFYKPFLSRIKDDGYLRLISLLYVLNEFDYRGSPSSDLVWSKSICGDERWQLCRSRALAMTSQRAVSNAREVVGADIPIGVKLAKFHFFSGWNKVDETDFDPLGYLVGNVLFPIGGALGYDCYWSDDAGDDFCGRDKSRFVSVFKSLNILEYFVAGKFELAEYGVFCRGASNDSPASSGLASGRRIITSDIDSFTKFWRDLASGFNLYALNAVGSSYGCYALAENGSFRIFEASLPAFLGLGRQPSFFFDN